MLRHMQQQSACRRLRRPDEHTQQPTAQDAVRPDNVSNVAAAAMMAASDPTMTGLDPIDGATQHGPTQPPLAAA